MTSNSKKANVEESTSGSSNPYENMTWWQGELLKTAALLVLVSIVVGGVALLNWLFPPL